MTQLDLTIDDLYTLEHALNNLIQDKKDYCAHEDGNDEAVTELEELLIKVQGPLTSNYREVHE